MNKELFLAVRRGDTASVVQLLDAGANVNDTGWHRWPLLTTAAMSDNADLVRALLDRGADRDAADKRDGKSALHWTAMPGRVEAVRALLEAGADANENDTFGNYTPIMLAAAHASGDKARDTISLLLEYGADIDARNKWGQTALFSAAIRPDTLLITFLAERGAAVNIRNNDGRTPLMWAARHAFKKVESVDRLLSNGAEIDLQDSSGKTALIWAAIYGEADALSCLLKQGASPDIQDAGGAAAMIHAARPAPDDCWIGVYRRQIAEGKSVERNTRCMMELQAKRHDLLAILHDHGADPSLRDAEGLTAQDWLARTREEAT